MYLNKEEVMTKVLLIIPAYNEEENIKNTIGKVLNDIRIVL